MSRKPLTLANWAKASGLGLLIWLFVSLVGGVERIGNYELVGMIAWIGGTLLACYVLELRSLKAFMAVVATVFVGILAVDIAMTRLGLF